MLVLYVSVETAGLGTYSEGKFLVVSFSFLSTRRRNDVDVYQNGWDLLQFLVNVG